MVIKHIIPVLFARAVEKEIWVLGICADYLEDHGKEGSVLRIIADNHFLLDESSYSTNSIVHYGFFDGYEIGYGYDYEIGYGYGDELGDGYYGIWWEADGYGNGNGCGVGETLGYSCGYY